MLGEVLVQRAVLEILAKLSQQRLIQEDDRLVANPAAAWRRDVAFAPLDVLELVEQRHQTGDILEATRHRHITLKVACDAELLGRAELRHLLNQRQQHVTLVSVTSPVGVRVAQSVLHIVQRGVAHVGVRASCVSELPEGRVFLDRDLDTTDAIDGMLEPVKIDDDGVVDGLLNDVLDHQHLADNPATAERSVQLSSVGVGAIATVNAVHPGVAHGVEQECLARARHVNVEHRVGASVGRLTRERLLEVGLGASVDTSDLVGLRLADRAVFVLDALRGLVGHNVPFDATVIRNGHSSWRSDRNRRTKCRRDREDHNERQNHRRSDDRKDSRQDSSHRPLRVVLFLKVVRFHRSPQSCC